MDQGEPGVDYNDPNLNPLECDICKQKFGSLDKLGEHQKVAHDMWNSWSFGWTVQYHYWEFIFGLKLEKYIWR